MTRLNLYSLSVSNGTLGSPAQNTDVTNGFFKWSIYGGTRSCKSETTHIDSLATLIIDDSIWEIYEGKTGDPCLENRSSGDRYNLTTDLVINPKDCAVTIVSSGCINEHPLGLQFVEHLEGSVDIKTYLAN